MKNRPRKESGRKLDKQRFSANSSDPRKKGYAANNERDNYISPKKPSTPANIIEPYFIAV